MRLIYSFVFTIRMLLSSSFKQCSRNIFLLRPITVRRHFTTNGGISELENKLFRASPQYDENDIWHKVNRVRKIWKVGTIGDIKQMPDTMKGLPQIAVMGRSNTGKSSLINHLFGKGNLAKASSRAGKTKDIELFSVNDKFVLADLPGFVTQDGQYAKEWQKIWEPLIRSYLNEFLPEDESSDLIDSKKKQSVVKGVLFLSDIRWRSTVEDQMMFHFIRDQLKLPVLLILTKDDRLSIIPSKTVGHNITVSEKVHQNRNRFARLRRLELNVRDDPHLHYSVFERRSRGHLRRFIKSLIQSPSQNDRHSMLKTAWENIDTSKIGKKNKK